VLLRKYVHKSYTYIPRSHPRGNWKQTYLLYYMLHILITFCVINCKLCNSSRRRQILSPYYTYYNDMILFKIQVTTSHLRPNTKKWNSILSNLSLRNSIGNRNRLAESINRISDLSTRMPTTGSHVCEECLTSFDSEQALEQHAEYSRYRRKGACWL
jgi:hypothetical protein